MAHKEILVIRQYNNGQLAGLIVGTIAGSIVVAILIVFIVLRKRHHVQHWNWRFCPPFTSHESTSTGNMRSVNDHWQSRSSSTYDTAKESRRSLIHLNSDGGTDAMDTELQSSVAMPATVINGAPKLRPEIKNNEKNQETHLHMKRYAATVVSIASSGDTSHKRSTSFGSSWISKPERVKSSTPSISISTVASHTLPPLVLQPLPPIPSSIMSPLPESTTPRRPENGKQPGKSWLSLSRSNSDATCDSRMEPTAAVPRAQPTARSSGVTIPSHYIYYYHRYLSPAGPGNMRTSGRDVELGAFADTEYASEDKHVSLLAKEESESPDDEYNETNLRLQSSEPEIPTSQTERYRKSYRKWHENQKRHTVSSIATVSTAPIFRQHPGEEVDLGFFSRASRTLSSEWRK